MMTSPSMSPFRIVRRILVLMSVLLMSQAVASAEDTPCITADVVNPILLPDGSQHRPGKLTVCHHGEYAPSSDFHEISIHQIPIGLFISRGCVAEDPDSTEPFFMFIREHGGGLRLYGYSLPLRGRTEAYIFESATAQRARESVRVAAASDQPDVDPAQCVQLS